MYPKIDIFFDGISGAFKNIEPAARKLRGSCEEAATRLRGGCEEYTFSQQGPQGRPQSKDIEYKEAHVTLSTTPWAVGPANFSLIWDAILDTFFVEF